MGLAKSEWLEAEERGWATLDSVVCEDCVSDEYLKALVRNSAESETCDYCGAHRGEPLAASANVILDAVGSTVRYYYADPTSAGVPFEGGFLIEPVTTSELFWALDLDCHDDFRDDLIESFVIDGWVPAANGHWASLHDNEVFAGSWEYFCNQIKHANRFFIESEQSDELEPQGIAPRDVLRLLGRLAENFDLIKRVEATSRLFRARVREPEDNWNLDAESLGAPPSGIAPAGRMNPAGISYLYLASDEVTAIAEVLRTPFGEVALATFEVSQDLSILDLTQLPDVPSLFDSTRRADREALLFLERFRRAIGEPIQKDGREHVDYLPSQVVSEFFALRFRRDAFVDGLDGVKFPSSVNPNGWNLVLFPADRGIKQTFSKVHFDVANIRSVQ